MPESVSLTSLPLSAAHFCPHFRSLPSRIYQLTPTCSHQYPGPASGRWARDGVCNSIAKAEKSVANYAVTYFSSLRRLYIWMVSVTRTFSPALSVTLTRFCGRHIYGFSPRFLPLAHTFSVCMHTYPFGVLLSLPSSPSLTPSLLFCWS